MVNARNLGVAGSALSFVGLILLLIAPEIGVAVVFVSRIIVLLASRGVALVRQVPSVYRNVFASLVLGVVALMVFVASTYATYLIVGSEGMPESLEDILSGGAMNILLAGILASWVILVVSLLYLEKAYRVLAKVFNVGFFKWSPIVYLAGVLVVVTGIGVVVLMVGALLELAAWMQVPWEEVEVVG